MSWVVRRIARMESDRRALVEAREAARVAELAELTPGERAARGRQLAELAELARLTGSEATTEGRCPMD